MVTSWLIIIILAYFFFSLSYLADKLILAGPPKPVSYTFFVGMTNVFVVLLIPFIKFYLPSSTALFWIVAEAAVFILGLYFMFSALEDFDVSKVMCVIGAVQPIFIFILTWIVLGQEKLNKADIFAFFLLLLGSIIISFEKKFKITWQYAVYTIAAAAMFSLDYIFSKIVFSMQGFLLGLIWVRIFVFIFALAFLLFAKSRKEIFSRKNIENKKAPLIFALGQSSGGVANLLQSFAISLAPMAFLPILNSLRGVQYIFLFLLAAAFSAFFPKALKEGLSKKTIAQKIISIILIGIGLAILVY